MESAPREVVITGCGAASALGRTEPELWEGLLAGRTGLGPIRSFDASAYRPALAGEVPDESADERLRQGSVSSGLDHRHRMRDFALGAAHEALDAARLDLKGEDSTRVGVIVATTLGAMSIGESYVRGTLDASRRLLHLPYYALATDMARALAVRGPVISPSIACASGTQAVGQACELIRRGHADVFVAGGAEALCEFVVAGFHCLRATTADAVRPFDVRRDGLLLGEGAAMLVIESESHALARGAPIEARIAGTGLAGDAVHMTAPARDGAGAARAMRAALQDAGVRPDEIDFISAHGTGTVYNDAMEGAAIRSVFGEAAGRIPVNSIKGAIGHTLGAAGAFEAILCARVLNEGLIPPTAGCDEIDPACGLDIVRGAPRRLPARTVLSTSSAFAGNNAALVLRRGPGPAGPQIR